ncbi:uncharacterized protein LOC110235028 [Exaiptasia diaphana]|uniref:NADP-dependent oxidoreductase domain-containing protein n=1 Tax=Exaiptasia diaphana TaxID=2652724 RepID=A0A913WYH7_EXADI|nr:uncharacterized protein LOC110235028 [Exaiptasia diaphana]KXJ27622.1 Prostaglandin F synthase [Exaiptasia diaphana]
MSRLKSAFSKSFAVDILLRQFCRQICTTETTFTRNSFDSSSEAIKLEANSSYRRMKSLHETSITDTITLNDKVKIPCFGLGVYDIDVKLTRKAVLCALETGYRQIDTAARYKNERSVGEAIRESGLKRQEVFVVTKVYHEDHGYNETRIAFEKSLKLLGVDFVDLYLIHFPVPGKVVETWKAMGELKEKGFIRSIGVSNFNIHHLEALKMHSEITPSVNQIEVHPFLQESSLVDYCKDRGIVIQAYSPLTRGQKLDNHVLRSLAYQYNRTPAQILLRWSLQKGFVCIPKSFQSERIKENSKVFDFYIEEPHMEILDSLEEGYRTGRDKILWPWNG